MEPLTPPSGRGTLLIGKILCYWNMTYTRTFVHNVPQVPITAWHIEALNKYAWKEKKKSRKGEEKGGRKERGKER